MIFLIKHGHNLFTLNDFHEILCEYRAVQVYRVSLILISYHPRNYFVFHSNELHRCKISVF
jgi:hypothetical protein